MCIRDSYTPDHINDYAKIYNGNLTDEKKRVKIEALLGPVGETFLELEEEDRVNFRSKVRDYVKAYAFLSQLIPFEDKELFKLYIFADALSRKLPAEQIDWPTEILQDVDLEAFKPKKIDTSDIELTRGNRGLDPNAFGGETTLPEEDLEQLSKIIEELNDTFGTSFTEEDKFVLGRMQENLLADQFLSNQLETSSKDALKASFEVSAREELGKLVDSHFKLYKKVQDDKSLGEFLMVKMFEQYCRKKSPEAA